MLRAFMILLVAVVFSVTGELLLKHGMNSVGFLSLRPGPLIAGLWRAFTNPYVLIGFGSVFLASIFWLSILSRVPLSWAYPMLSLSYVLVVFASWWFLGEHLSMTRVLGVLVIWGGVFLVYRS